MKSFLLMAMCATVDADGSSGFNEMSATIHKFPAPATKQSLQHQIARIAPPGSSKYQIEVHSSDGHPIRVFPRKSEGRTYYTLKPFQSPFMCPFGVHVIRFYSDANERLEVPDDEYPTVRLGPRETSPEDNPASDDSDPSAEWREIRREKAQQEVELGTQQLLLNQQNINEHGDVTRSTGQLVRRHHEYVVSSTALALDTQQKIAAMNDLLIEQQQRFVETTNKMMAHFVEVVDKLKAPPPPTDWAKVTESLFNGIARVGSTLIAAAKGGEALPPGVVAAGPRRMAAPLESENRLPSGAAAKPIEPPKAAEPVPSSRAALEAPAVVTPPAVTKIPAPTPKPDASADKDQDPPDPPARPPAAQPEPPASAAESEPTPAPAATKPALTFRQKLRQSVRSMIRYFLAFSPAEYVGMLEAPGEIAEYVDALSTLAVPHEEILAGLRA